MRLFGKKDAKKKTPEIHGETKVKGPKPLIGENVAGKIVKPRITEKAAILGERNVYTFEVAKGATKHDVRAAIKALYNVTPVRINMVNKQPRHYMSKMRGRNTMEHGLKKAYIYLKEGDRIELV